jgi:hypothetical protein
MMDEAYLTAIAALAGSAVGALASLGTTWLTQNSQERSRRLADSMSRREHLYGEFIDHASKLYVDALTHQLDEPSKLVNLYALLCKLRLFAPAGLLRLAEQVMERIIATYSEPNKDFADAMKEEKPEALDLLRGFSQACREDLRLD